MSGSETHGIPDQAGSAWQAQEVVRELDDLPHLLLRIRISGGPFPHLDAPPFVRLVGRNATAESWLADVGEDQSSMNGYFPLDLDLAEGVVEYGYGARVWGRVPGPFDPLKIERLDRERLPRDLVPVTGRLVRRTQAGRVPPELRMPPRRRRPR